MSIRGIRGATTIASDTQETVLAAARELLEEILQINRGLETEDIASAIFTVTADIRSAFPAAAARELGWDQVPMLCMQEIPVEGSLPLCIRVLIHWNIATPQSAIEHVYLRGAKALRPDLSD